MITPQTTYISFTFVQNSFGCTLAIFMNVELGEKFHVKRLMSHLLTVQRRSHFLFCMVYYTNSAPWLINMYRLWIFKQLMSKLNLILFEFIISLRLRRLNLTWIKTAILTLKLMFGFKWVLKCLLQRRSREKSANWFSDFGNQYADF